MGLRTMKTIIKSTLLSFASLAVAFAGFAMTAQAQQSSVVQEPAVTQQYVMPGVPPQIRPQNEFYFGFSIQLISNGYSKTLKIVSVTPGSPAQLAGLEPGDEIRSVNGQGFSYARDSFEAANLLSRFVSTANVNGGPAPAATAPTIQQPYYVARPIANMVVRNVRNGQNVLVTVRPTRRFALPVPTVAAQTATSQLPVGSQ